MNFRASAVKHDESGKSKEGIHGNPASESVEYLLSPILPKGGRRGEKIDNSADKKALLEGQETRANANASDKLSPAEGSEVTPEPLEGRPLVKISLTLPLPT